MTPENSICGALYKVLCGNAGAHRMTLHVQTSRAWVPESSVGFPNSCLRHCYHSITRLHT